jgi:hypothetical protein
LPHNLEIECKNIVDQIEEEQHMAYVTSMERIAMEEGKLEGRLEMALEMVRQLNVSVKKAAEVASVSVKDLMDRLNQEGKPKS